MSEQNALLARLTSNLHGLELRIQDACQRSDRQRESVQLVAVTKSVPLATIAALVQCGPALLGENRPQQLVERARVLQMEKDSGNRPPVQWHLIGQLQRNKIRSVLPWTSLIHSVESPSQLQQIGRIAGELSLRPRVLVQVNVSGEESKSGFSPASVREAWEGLTQIGNVDLAGLMTMAPLTDDQAVIRDSFRGLRELRDELQLRTPHIPLQELSMGMSHDFEIAIEEGATFIRVGSLLFEGCEE